MDAMAAPQTVGYLLRVTFAASHAIPTALGELSALPFAESPR